MRIRLIILTIILSLLFASALPAAQRGLTIVAETPSGKAIPLYSGSYALVIGNGDYTNGWDPLPGAIRDVKDVSRALKENGFQVILKKNLTRSGFNRALGDFFYKYGRNKTNRLLFYYAGHGHTQQMFTDEALGYLVMVDAPVPEKDPVGFNVSSVDMQAIVTQAKMTKARHVLFMFDSCFSGSILNLRERIVPETISDSISLPVRQFITAGRANEPVPDHSIFKQAFLDLLEGRDKEPIPDGYITGEELGLYLKNKVPEYNPTQHPQYGKIKDIRLDKGDFVFSVKSRRTSKAAHDRLREERKHLEREKLELEQLKLEIERERLKSERERLMADKKKYSIAKLPPKQKQSSSISAVSKEKIIVSDGRLIAHADGTVLNAKKQKTPNAVSVSKDGEAARDDRFIAYANGTVLDTKTNLMWAGQDNGIGLAEYNVKDYFADYREGGYADWRMPTMDELETIYDRYRKNQHGYYVTKLIDITGGYVWGYEGWGTIWAFNFSQGGRATGDSSGGNARIRSARALPVRTGKRESHTQPSSDSNVIKRDSIYVAYANGIVKDTNTGLEWVAGSDEQTTFEEAKSWVQSLNIDGGGWRMPTEVELDTLYKTGAGYRNMTPLLKTTAWVVWGVESEGSSIAGRFDFRFATASGTGIPLTSPSTRAFAVRSRGD